MAISFEEKLFGGNLVNENPIYVALIVILILYAAWYFGYVQTWLSYLPSISTLTGSRGDPQLWEYSYDLQNAVSSKVKESRNAGPAEVASSIQKFGMREGSLAAANSDDAAAALAAAKAAAAKSSSEPFSQYIGM